MRRPLPLPGMTSVISVGALKRARRTGASGFVRPAGWKLAAIWRRSVRPITAAGSLTAAIPVGIAASTPGVNGAEIALWILTSTLLWAVWPTLTKGSR